MIIEDRSVFDLPSRECSRVEKYGEDPDNFIEIFEPVTQSLGQVVLIHGGSWRIEYDLAHLRSYAGALSDAGYRVQLVEYRRTPGFPDNYSDDIRKASAIIIGFNTVKLTTGTILFNVLLYLVLITVVFH